MPKFTCGVRSCDETAKYEVGTPYQNRRISQWNGVIVIPKGIDWVLMCVDHASPIMARRKDQLIRKLPVKAL